MIAVIQRVTSSKVVVDDRTVGKIGKGIMVLLGVEVGDGIEEVEYCARKAAELRIFPDGENKMNLSVLDVGGEALVISQFTLPGRIGKGRRPSFIDAMGGIEAENLYMKFVEELRNHGIHTETGIFGAMMDVHLVNDGPVTLILDSKNRRK